MEFRRKALHQRSNSENNASISTKRTPSTSTKSSGRAVSRKSSVSENALQGPIRVSSDMGGSTPRSTSASLASFGSLPPVPPLHINKIPPLNIKKRESDPANYTFASDIENQLASSSTGVAPLQPAPVITRKRQSLLPNPVLSSSRFITPSSSTTVSSSPSHSSSSSRPLPLKPILKKAKKPLPPYSVQEYEEKRSSWDRVQLRSSSRASGHAQSIRVVKGDMDSKASTVSSPSQGYSRRSTLSAVSPRSTLSPVGSLSPSNRLASSHQSSFDRDEFDPNNNAFLSSMSNTHSTRRSSVGISEALSPQRSHSRSRTPSDSFARHHSRIPSDGAAGPSNLPAWARKYYGSGERGIGEETEPRRPRRASQGDSLNISEVLRDPRRRTYPMYASDDSQSDLTRWPSPHLEAPPPARTESIRQPHMLFFAFGFIFPLLWIIGAFWPLGVKPRYRTVDDPEAQHGPEIEMYFTVDDERKFNNARWWRRVNRFMAVAGVALIATIITLGVLGWKMVPSG